MLAETDNTGKFGQGGVVTFGVEHQHVVTKFDQLLGQETGDIRLSATARPSDKNVDLGRREEYLVPRRVGTSTICHLAGWTRWLPVKIGPRRICATPSPLLAVATTSACWTNTSTEPPTAAPTRNSTALRGRSRRLLSPRSYGVTHPALQARTETAGLRDSHREDHQLVRLVTIWQSRPRRSMAAARADAVTPTGRRYVPSADVWTEACQFPDQAFVTGSAKNGPDRGGRPRRHFPPRPDRTDRRSRGRPE